MTNDSEERAMTTPTSPRRADVDREAAGVERVAVRLFIANYGQGGCLGAWVDQAEDTREHYRDLAQAAIEELGTL